MNALQCLLVAACLAVIAALIALVLPSSWEVARDVQIHDDLSGCHEVAANLELWQHWFPWGQDEHGFDRLQTGHETWGEGATLSWSASDVGPGTLTLLSEDPVEGLEFEVLLREGRERIVGRIDYKELGTISTRLSLSLHGEVGSSDLIGRYLALKRAYTIGPDLVDALVLLRRQIETEP